MPAAIEPPGFATPRHNLNAVEVFAGIFLAWTLFGLLNVYPGHVHYDTAEVAMWAALEPDLGYRKHPPLMPWLFRLYGLIVPLDWITLTILAGINITVGAYAVWRIGCMVLGEDRAPAVMSIFIASPYSTWAALKLDHNAILVSLWPLAVWAFLAAMRRPDAWRGALLGVAAAAAMYAKYTSALLLLALGVAALLDPRRSSFFRAPAPWVAAGVAALLIAPHAWWAQANPVAALGLVTQEVAPGSPRAIVLRNISLLLPSIAMSIGALAVFGRVRFHLTAELRILVIAIAIPYAIILLLTLGFGLRGSPAWAMPVFAVLPVLLAAPVAAPPQRLFSRLQWAFRGLLIAIVAVAPLLLMSRFRQSEGTASEPRHEVAASAIAVWRQATTQPLHIVAGEHRFAMAAHLVAVERPRVWSMFEEPTPWITPALIDRHGMLALCLPGSRLCGEAMRQLVGRRGWLCEVSAQRSWRGVVGPRLVLAVVIVPPQGVPVDGRCPPPG